MGGIETLALLAVGGGQAERAARLLGHGIAAYAARGDERLATERAIYDRLRTALTEALPADARERYGGGRGLGKARAVTEVTADQVQRPLLGWQCAAKLQEL